jgi:hypothetical protein
MVGLGRYIFANFCLMALSSELGPAFGSQRIFEFFFLFRGKWPKFKTLGPPLKQYKHLAALALDAPQTGGPVSHHITKRCTTQVVMLWAGKAKTASRRPLRNSITRLTRQSLTVVAVVRVPAEQYSRLLSRAALHPR